MSVNKTYMVITLQYIHIPNHYALYLKLIQCLMLILFQQTKQNKTKQKTADILGGGVSFCPWEWICQAT